MCPKQQKGDGHKMNGRKPFVDRSYEKDEFVQSAWVKSLVRVAKPNLKDFGIRLYEQSESAFSVQLLLSCTFCIFQLLTVHSRESRP